MNLTYFTQSTSRKERFTLPTSSRKTSGWKIPNPSDRFHKKYNSPSATWPWQKRPNPEKPKPSKTPIPTKNVDTGPQTKTNDTIGSLSYIRNIFSINTFAGPTVSSSPWPLSLRRGKPNNAGAITKRWKRSTNTSQKY